jgi:predicted GNAT family acetyltransferase
MHTSYEQRLELLQQFSQGSEAFQKNIPDAMQIQGDGWQLTSIGSRFSIFNGVQIQTARKEAVDEVIAALATHNIPADIRLVGPGINHISALAEHGYKNFGGTPFMLWSADNSVDDFKIRAGLTACRLVPSDLETMNAIYADVYGMGPEIIADFDRMLFASDNDHTYGLFKDGEMVSLVTAMIYKDTIGIWSMGTPTAHQKNGFGEQLLKYVMKTHKEMGAKNFFLHASSAGKYLYDKCGWIVLDYLPYLSKVDEH